jgi:ubiquinone/menaquinone biosynthesis C-methylase UbiE
MLPLLERGMHVDGVDTSSQMLEACRKRIAGHEDKCSLYQQALHELDLPFTGFDAAFIPASSFCLIADPDQALASLKRIREHLSDGAKLLLEFEPPTEFDPEHTQSSRTITNGGQQIRFVGQRSYDADRQLEIHRNTYELKQSGSVVATEEETLHLRCYNDEQMTQLLQQAGFATVTIERPEFGSVAVAS